MRSSVALTIATTLCLLACSGIIIGIMVNGWKSNVSSTWQLASSETQMRIVQAINGSLNFIKFAALSVPAADPNLATATTPVGGSDPSSLARMFFAYDTQSGYSFASAGMISRDPKKNDTAEYGGQPKYEQQIAYQDGCPQGIYVYTNASIHPLYRGYCVASDGTVDWSRIAYNGTDWGLAPQEESILDGTIEATFKPIFVLLNAFTLTYEAGYPQGLAGAKYATTFAEMDLTTFTNFVAGLSIMNGKGYAYVAEIATGSMVACTTPSAVFNVNGTRLFAQNSSVDAVSATFSTAALYGQLSDASAGNWRISADRYTDAGIDWLIVVAVPYSSVYGDMNKDIGTAAGVSVVVIVVTAVINILILWLFLGRHARYIASKLRGESSTKPGYAFSDLSEIEDEIEK